MENLPNGIRSFAWAAIWSLQRIGNDIMPQIFFGKGLAWQVYRSLQAFVCIGSRMKNSATRQPRISLLSFRWVNDMPQACIKSSQLALAPGISCKFLSGGKNG
jgi:hypothetical protein